MKENNGNNASGGLQDGLQFDEDMCERYIFGELSPADQEKFEETYFSDDAFFERYIAVKTELLDLLARGELSPEKRSRMEPHFQATAPRRRKIEDSAIFTRSVTEIAKRRVPRAAALIAPAAENDGLISRLTASITSFFSAPRLAALAVLVLVVAGGLYFLNRSSSPYDGNDMALILEDPVRTSDEQIAASPEPGIKEEAFANEPEIPAGPSADGSTDTKSSASDISLRTRGSRKSLPNRARIMTQPSPSSSRPPVNDRSPTGFALTLSTVGRDTGSEGLTQSIVLHPGATRDRGETDTLVLRAGNDHNWAAIHLVFRSEHYPDYVVTISNMAGKVVLKDNDFLVERRPDGSDTLVVWIEETSAFKESEKDYIVTLQGKTKSGVLETIEEYYFHVRRIDPKAAPNNSPLLAAELSGTVVGPTGEPVSKAVVTAKNITTGMTRNIMSLEDGSYRMEQLPPGHYEIYAEAASLKRTVIKDLSLTSSSRVELPIVMESGGSDVVRIENLSITNPRPSITLEPMFSPGSVGVKKLELHGDAQVADIELRAPVTGHSSFNATIRTVDGKTVYSRNLIRNAVVKGIVKLSVRSKLLRAGDHVVQLRGRSKKGKSEPIAEFYFHVQKLD